MGVDPGFGSSPFGIVITQFSDDQVQILYAKEFERQDFNDVIDKVAHLASKYGFSINNGSKIFVDGANPSVIKGLKDRIGENPNYEELLKEYKSMNVKIENTMLVVPVNFNQEHKKMLIHSKQLLEEDHISINKKFDKLITSLRTAVETEGSLDKETTSFNDIFDAFRLSLKYYKLNG